MSNPTAFLGDYVTLKSSPGPVFKVTEFDIRKARVRLSWDADEPTGDPMMSRHAWIPVTSIAGIAFANYANPIRYQAPTNKRKFR